MTRGDLVSSAVSALAKITGQTDILSASSSTIVDVDVPPVRRRHCVKRRDRCRSRSRSPLSRSSHNERLVYICNIPYEATTGELTVLLKNVVAEPSLVELLSMRDGRPKGAA